MPCEGNRTKELGIQLDTSKLLLVLQFATTLVTLQTGQMLGIILELIYDTFLNEYSVLLYLREI